MKALLTLFLVLSLTSSNDLRIYESGMAFLINKNYDQALKEFHTLVEQYPESERADDALLEIAKYYYQNEDYDNALSYLDKLINEYKNSDSVDNALFYKGLILLKKGETDKAYELFFKVKTGFPSSDVLDKVYYYLGEVSGLKGYYKQGLFFLSTVYMRFPESEYFAPAMKKASYFYHKIGNPAEGLKMLSIINTEGLNDKETDLLTENLLRFYLKKKFKSKTVYYQMEKPSIMVSDKKGKLFVFSKEDDYIYVIEKGKMKKFSTPGSVTSMWYSPYFGFFYSTENRVFAKDQGTSLSFSLNGELLNYIVSIAVDYFGNYYVYDKDKAVIGVFDSRGNYKSRIVAPADYIKIRKDGYRFVVKDSRNIVEVYNMDGKRAKTITGFRKITDLDFDNYDNIYMITDKGKTLIVLTEDFTLFQRLDLYGTFGRKFYHLAVGGDGSVYLSDKSSQIVRLR